MNEELKQFDEELKTSKDLQKKFEEALKRIEENGEAKSDGDVVVRAAAELGYTFTVGDLERAKAGDEKLDADELEQLSGGSLDWSTLCAVNYACFSIFMHSSKQNKTEPCYVDYQCIRSFH